MGWIATGWSELVGLFVDDGRLAVAVLVWLAVCGLLLPRLGLNTAWLAAALFLGIISILAYSVLRRAGERI